MSFSRLLDLRAEASRVVRHVKPPRYGEASRRPRALSQIRTQAIGALALGSELTMHTVYHVPPLYEWDFNLDHWSQTGGNFVVQDFGTSSGHSGLVHRSSGLLNAMKFENTMVN